MKVWRQGDVAIMPLKTKIADELIEKKDLILANGEVTGHAHRITRGDAKLFCNNAIALALDEAKEMQINCYTETEITHEEHEGIVLPIGDHHIVIQREYDWASKMARKVVD